MAYRYELHAHTSEVSVCGRLPVAELIAKYKAAGYDGIVLTDHYSPMTFPLRKHFSKKQITAHYLRAYREAKQMETEDFSVLFGMELRFYGTVNDYLVYGLSPEMLDELPVLLPLRLGRAAKLLHEKGCLVLQAHPFRPWCSRANPKHLDGAEVWNGKTDAQLNAKAKAWADAFGGIEIGGSDCHRDASFGTSGIITQEKIRSNDDLLRILKSGAFEIYRKEP